MAAISKRNKENLNASIIVPVYNQLIYFKQCISSIRKCAPRSNYELIVIDNGSEKETKRYISSIDIDILVRNKNNLGVAKAWNQGIKVATTDKFLIVNSDIVVGKRWFENMTNALDKELYVQPGSWTREIRKDFFEKAEELSRNEFSLSPTNSLNGFCFGIKRETLEKVGYFDESFIVWVDKDYVERLRKGGFEQQEIMNTMVHHFESKTLDLLIKNGLDWEENDRTRWHNKWES